MFKFFSSIVLCLFICLATFVRELFLPLGICTIIMCLIKFLIVTILEPDTLWEIIKKFIYILVLIIVAIGLGRNNTYCLIVCSIIIILDTICESARFIRYLKA